MSKETEILHMHRQYKFLEYRNADEETLFALESGICEKFIKLLDAEQLPCER